ncbi:MAG: serine/threonine protein kinase [Candidatus Obscuribacterales bacterium]|nr:serine/threonine protein kinase [Candidatus Obscuribacterales bacterium]
MADLYRRGDLVGDDYRLGRPIGRGGMGAVFLAEHKLIPGSQYALKLLYPHLVNQESWHRFQAEARVLARLDHQGIVKVFNFGIDKSKDGECPFYVMEYLDGESLASYVKHSERQRLEVGRAISIIILVAQALDFSHRHGVIHRDVKPSNIIVIDPEGKASIKLVDFGIAKEVQKEGLFQVSDSVRQYATAAGAIFGTPYYLSPEQASGGEVGKQSDIYSLGCTLFECLTGRPPFVGENAFETISMHVSAPQPRLSEIDKGNQFDEDLERILALALAKSPQLRYQSMAQFALDLERYLHGLSVYAAGIKSTGFSGPVLRAVQDSEEERRRKRKRLILLSVLPLCLAVVACLFVPRLLALKTIPLFTENDRRHSQLNGATGEVLGKIANEALKNENLVDEAKARSSGNSSQQAKPAAQLSDERRKFFLTQLDCIGDVYVTKYGTADYGLFENELLAGVKPYKVKASIKAWHFRFPSQFCLGRLSLDGKDYPARGDVVLPQSKNGDKPMFYLREGFSPLFLKGFEPDSVRLYFTIGEDAQARQAAEALKGWGQIEHLRLAHYKISKLSWRLLKAIPSPVIIQISDCRFELPDDDSKVGFSKLEYLSLNCPHTECSEIMALLRWASSLPKLGRYELDRLPVDDAVIAALAKLKAYRGLSLSRTIVSAEQLKLLCQSKTITGLIVTDWDFEASDVLACMPFASHIKTVVLMDPAYSAEQKAEIKSAGQVSIREIVWSDAERARIANFKNLQLITRRYYFDITNRRFYKFDD